MGDNLPQKPPAPAAETENPASLPAREGPKTENTDQRLKIAQQVLRKKENFERKIEEAFTQATELTEEFKTTIDSNNLFIRSQVEDKINENQAKLEAAYATITTKLNDAGEKIKNNDYEGAKTILTETKKLLHETITAAISEDEKEEYLSPESKAALQNIRDAIQQKTPELETSYQEYEEALSATSNLQNIPETTAQPATQPADQRNLPPVSKAPAEPPTDQLPPPNPEFQDPKIALAPFTPPHHAPETTNLPLPLPAEKVNPVTPEAVTEQQTQTTNPTKEAPETKPAEQTQNAPKTQPQTENPPPKTQPQPGIKLEEYRTMFLEAKNSKNPFSTLLVWIKIALDLLIKGEGIDAKGNLKPLGIFGAATALLEVHSHLTNNTEKFATPAKLLEQHFKLTTEKAEDFQIKSKNLKLADFMEATKNNTALPEPLTTFGTENPTFIQQLVLEMETNKGDDYLKIKTNKDKTLFDFLNDKRLAWKLPNN